MKTLHLLGLCLLVCLLSCKSKTSKETPQPSETAPSISQNTIPSRDDAITTHDTKAYGIDISHFQGDEINYLNKTKDSLDFVICKATEGITYTDPEFRHNWNTIMKNGFIKGAYHFYKCDDDIQPQADNFLNAIGNIQPTDLPPIIDFEEASIDKSQSVATIQENLLKFLVIIKERTGRTPMIYTNLDTGNAYLNYEKFSDYPLWIAYYQKSETPTLPEAWKNATWKFWQNTDEYHLEQFVNDLDVFNGDREALLSFIKEQ